jgi:hypothetical protein
MSLQYRDAAKSQAQRDQQQVQRITNHSVCGPGNSGEPVSESDILSFS